MFILCVGLNHRSAPVEVREKLSFPEAQLPDALGRLRREAGIAGCAILSTCNRTEVYVATTDMEKGFAAVRRFLNGYYPMDRSDFSKYFYSYSLYDAIRHLFRVASGLDSMVLGETQILGQVKQAFQTACECQVSNGIINTLFQQAITVGKRVRTDTGIDRMAVSISYAAVELARQIFGDLNGKTVLILGAGKMSELTVKHLVSNGVDTVLVSNRSHNRAVELAEQFGGKAIMFDQLYQNMEKADIVISCTAASHYVIHPGPMEQVMAKRGGRKVFLIDIAVPRDIDPKVGEISGVSLFDIDDLQNVVDRNLEERRNAAVIAEQIVEEEIDEFLKWLNSLFVVPTIIALKEKGEAIKEKELDRVLRKLPGLTDKEKKIVGSLANSIVNQLLHDPIVQIRRYAATHQGHLYSEVLQNLFNLEVRGQMPKANREEEAAVGDNP